MRKVTEASVGRAAAPSGARGRAGGRGVRDDADVTLLQDQKKQRRIANRRREEGQERLATRGWIKSLVVQITTSLQRVRLGLLDCVADSSEHLSVLLQGLEHSGPDSSGVLNGTARTSPTSAWSVSE